MRVTNPKNDKSNVMFLYLYSLNICLHQCGSVMLCLFRLFNATHKIILNVTFMIFVVHPSQTVYKFVSISHRNHHTLHSIRRENSELNKLFRWFLFRILLLKKKKTVHNFCYLCVILCTVFAVTTRQCAFYKRFFFLLVINFI